MIYMGYDMLEQGVVAWNEDTAASIFVRDGAPGAEEVLNGLHSVSEPSDRENEIWMCQVQYSDQAWDDLICVGELL